MKYLRSIMSGEKQPDANDYRQTDGVSCFFCHQISKIYDSKAHKINFSNYKGNNKPVVFGKGKSLVKWMHLENHLNLKI